MTIDGLNSHYSDNSTRYHELTKEQVEFIILKAFDILENTGMRFADAALETFKSAGCAVGGVCHYLDLPIMGTAGTTSSKVVDGQLAVEQAFTVNASALCGGPSPTTAVSWTTG